MTLVVWLALLLVVSGSLVVADTVAVGVIVAGLDGACTATVKRVLLLRGSAALCGHSLIPDIRNTFCRERRQLARRLSLFARCP